MAELDRKSRLKKELGLLDVYAIATGATLSAGLFLLPGLVAGGVGPALVLAYMVAALPMIPAMFSIVELATAMPRAGGAYYFVDRSLGPLAGTIAGLGTWLALTLKTAFALVGVGAYTHLFFPDAPMLVIACGLAVAFGVINWLGAKKSGQLQIWFVSVLLLILVWFVLRGSVEIEAVRFEGFFGAGRDSILATAGVVYISYVGVTNVASVSEEVKRPERNLPLAVFLALGTAVIVYALCIVVLTGVVPPEILDGDHTPMATAAQLMVGRVGMIVLSIAALIAFCSVANSAVLSASRYPLAMSRDHLLPRWLRSLSPRRTPTYAILLTVGAIILYLLVLDPLKIAKLASAFQLLMFAMLCVAVIVMRESRIESYDPGFRSPLYPWMQIAGILAPCVLIVEMGWIPILFSAGLIVGGIVWYFGYAHRRVARFGAIYHVFERLGRRRFDALDRELRGILKEKGLRDHDPFVAVVGSAALIDADEATTFEAIVERAARHLARRVPQTEEQLASKFLEGTRIGATPVAKGAALPHLRVPDIDFPLMVMVRSRSGVYIETGDVFGELVSHRRSYAIFFLVSPESDPGQHLRLLAELASRVDQADFLTEWRAAHTELRLREILLRHERYVSLTLGSRRKTAAFIDRRLREIELPHGCLVAVIHRDGDTIVPGGDTVLREGDQLTVIGSESAVRECTDRYGADLPEPKA